MKKISLFVLPMFFIISLFIVSCNNDNNQNMNEQFEEEKLALKEDLEDARDDIQEDLNEVQQELSDLQDQMANNMENANDELKAQWQEMENNLEKRKEELNKEKEELSDRISDIANATRENWEDFKMDAREWVDDINN